MKSIRKFAAMFISFLMIGIMLPVGALAAAPTGTLTMQDGVGATKTTSSYSAYQVVSFNASLLNGKTVYTDAQLNPNYKSAIVGSLSLGAPSDSEVLTAMESMDADHTAALAVALKNAGVSSTAPTGFTYASTTNGVFNNNLPYGYYLVVETANGTNDGTVISKPILVSVPLKDATAITNEVAVKVKTSSANITKKIEEKNDSILVDSSVAALGDTIYYRTLSDFPTYSSDATEIAYSVTDTMSKGLTYGGIDSVQIVQLHNDYDTSHPTAYTMKQSLDKDTDYMLTPPSTADADGNTSFKLELTGTNKDANIKAWGNAGYKLLIRYHVTLNSDASVNIGSKGNPNSAKLTYSIKPDSGDTYTTPDDTVITYANKLVITKTDGTTPLPGAVFTLYSSADSGSTWTAVQKNGADVTAQTDANGKATFDVLEPGTSYKIVETTVPNGYSKADDVTFTLSAKNTNENTTNTYQIPNIEIVQPHVGNADALAFLADWDGGNANIAKSTGDDGLSAGTLEIGIVDKAGFTLPGTGGIGTTIFTVSGLAIILLGGCMALVYNKKKKKTSRHAQH